jgi:hypothetical protein
MAEAVKLYQEIGFPALQKGNSCSVRITLLREMGFVQ